MFRIAAIGAVCVIGLSGCYDNRSGNAPAANLAQSKPEAHQNFVYTHNFALDMARDYIKPRFERAQDRCFHDAALNCELISASLQAGNPDQDETTQAQLVVALPHDKVEVYEQALLESLPNEVAGDVIVRSRSTDAQNVTQEATDIDHRIAQLTNYRDRLSQIAQRGDVHADDLIRIEQELSSVQSQLDQAVAQKSDVGERVKREVVTISLGERQLFSDAWRPIAHTWRNGFATLAESAAVALQFTILITPWLLVIGGIVLLARRISGSRRGRKSAPKLESKTND